ncbi:Cel, partial [Symbiodinium sp. CCMP2456]
MGCGGSAWRGQEDTQSCARPCNACHAVCALHRRGFFDTAECSLCATSSMSFSWTCVHKCGFQVCLPCELNIAMDGDSVERLQMALRAVEHHEARDPEVAAASLQLQLCDRLDMACGLTSFQQLEEAISAAEGQEALMVRSHVQLLLQRLDLLADIDFELRRATEGHSIELLQDRLRRAEEHGLDAPERLRLAHRRLDQLRALQRLNESLEAAVAVPQEIREAIAACMEAQLEPEQQPAVVAAQARLDFLQAAVDLAEASLNFDADALQLALEEARRVAIDAARLSEAEDLLAELSVTCAEGHRLQRLRGKVPPCACQGCYAQSDAKELTWSRCEPCDYALCHYCVAWRAKGRQRFLEDSPPEAEEAEATRTSLGARSAEGPSPEAPELPGAVASEDSSPVFSLGFDEAEHRKWFDCWAARMNAQSAQWELFRGGEWVPFGIGLCNKLTAALGTGDSTFRYVATNQQEHLFNFDTMEQVIVATGKRRSMRRVLWEIELDIGWVLVEEELALQLQMHEVKEEISFEYFARGMNYTVNLFERNQLNLELGTKRSLRKVALQDVVPKMSRQQLRMALEDDFPKFACATRQWIMMRWPWQQIGDCSIDACQFVETGLADEIASGLAGMQEGVPQLGGILQNILWFDYVDDVKMERLTQTQVVNAVAQDSRWRWGHAGAEDAVSALWVDLGLVATEAVSKLECLVAG